MRDRHRETAIDLEASACHMTHGTGARPRSRHITKVLSDPRVSCREDANHFIDDIKHGFGHRSVVALARETMLIVIRPSNLGIIPANEFDKILDKLLVNVGALNGKWRDDKLVDQMHEQFARIL